MKNSTWTKDPMMLLLWSDDEAEIEHLEEERGETRDEMVHWLMTDSCWCEDFAGQPVETWDKTEKLKRMRAAFLAQGETFAPPWVVNSKNAS